MELNGIIQMRKAGSTYQEIADALGVSRQRVWTIIKEKAPEALNSQNYKQVIKKIEDEKKVIQANVSKQKEEGKGKVIKAKIVDLYSKGYTQAQIGKRLKKAQTTISKILREEGYISRDSPRRSAEETITLIKTIDFLRGENKTWQEIGSLVKTTPIHCQTLWQRYIKEGRYTPKNHQTREEQRKEILKKTKKAAALLQKGYTQEQAAAKVNLNRITLGKYLKEI